MTRRLWQMWQTLPRITPPSRRLQAWSHLEPLIPRRLLSSLSLTYTVPKDSMTQRKLEEGVSTWPLQPYHKPRVLGSQERYYSSYGDDGARDGMTSTPALPKLPVPKLKATMNKYLSVLSTVLSPHELHVTTRHVTEFMTPGGWADKLQEYLLERQEDTDNWACDWWLRCMY
ncbi:hypothetical protein ACOMHN_067632 [Nucella lapillus]